MKKIIGIFVILLIATGVFGQMNIGSLSRIEYDNWQSTNDLVHFSTNINDYTFYYILAYEPNFSVGNSRGTERNVYLYCIKTSGSRWLRVSDTVLENYYHDAENYQDIDFYTYDKNRHNTSNSSVSFDGNDVIFTLEVHKMENGSITTTPQTFILELKDHTFNGNYYRLRK